MMDGEGQDSQETETLPGTEKLSKLRLRYFLTIFGIGILSTVYGTIELLLPSESNVWGYVVFHITGTIICILSTNVLIDPGVKPIYRNISYRSVVLLLIVLNLIISIFSLSIEYYLSIVTVSILLHFLLVVLYCFTYLRRSSYVETISFTVLTRC